MFGESWNEIFLFEADLNPIEEILSWPVLELV